MSVHVPACVCTGGCPLGARWTPGGRGESVAPVCAPPPQPSHQDPRSQAPGPLLFWSTMSVAHRHPLATELCLLSLQGLARAQDWLVLQVSWVCGQYGGRFRGVGLGVGGRGESSVTPAAGPMGRAVGGQREGGGRGHPTPHPQPLITIKL